MAYAFPEEPLSADCAILMIPSQLVPIVAGLFSTLQYRAKWVTDADYQNGRRAFAELEAQLVNMCFSLLIQEIRDARGVADIYSSVPVEERTSAMYRSLNDVVGRLNDIRIAIDGGVAHDDNLMIAIRGETEADETRNILEALS